MNHTDYETLEDKENPANYARFISENFNIDGLKFHIKHTGIQKFVDMNPKLDISIHVHTLINGKIDTILKDVIVTILERCLSICTPFFPIPLTKLSHQLILYVLAIWPTFMFIEIAVARNSTNMYAINEKCSFQVTQVKSTLTTRIFLLIISTSSTGAQNDYDTLANCNRVEHVKI